MPDLLRVSTGTRSGKGFEMNEIEFPSFEDMAFMRDQANARQRNGGNVSAKFKEGQLVEWVTDFGIVNCRARILRKSVETFISGDRILSCWDLIQLNGQWLGAIAEKNIRAVVVDA